MGEREGDTRETWCLAIGGGEEKEEGRETLRRFLGLAGGHGARVVLVELGEESVRGPVLASQLREAGASQVHEVHAADGAALDDAELEQAARGATSFYLLGGASAHGDLLKGSRFGREMSARALAGAVVAASGGAAALLGDYVIAAGQKKSTSPSKGFVSLRSGLGLVPGTTFDGPPNPARYVRLLTAVAQNPFQLGIAVDEMTTAVFAPDGVIEVHGAGSITVVDGSSAGYSNYFALKDDQPVGLTGARVCLLVSGMRYDIAQRAYIYPENERSRKRISAQAEARALMR